MQNMNAIIVMEMQMNAECMKNNVYGGITQKNAKYGVFNTRYSVLVDRMYIIRSMLYIGFSNYSRSLSIIF